MHILSVLVLTLRLCSCAVKSDKENYYSILGVKKDASNEEIKQSYRKLAKKWHPDKNSDPSAPKRFLEISEAYETLGSESARANYDASLFGRRNPMQPRGFHSFQTRHFEHYDVRSFFDDMQRAKRGGGNFYYSSSSFQANYSFGPFALLKILAGFVIFWTLGLGCLVQWCCHRKTTTTDNPEAPIAFEEEEVGMIPMYTYSMKLRKGFLIVSCNKTTRLVLQDLIKKHRFKNDHVTFAHKNSNKEFRSINGEVYGIILTCLKGTKWAGHSILDSDIETWIEKALCGEIQLTHVDVHPCPI